MTNTNPCRERFKLDPESTINTPGSGESSELKRLRATAKLDFFQVVNATGSDGEIIVQGFQEDGLPIEDTFELREDEFKEHFLEVSGT